jgi:hypothetical protein
MHVRPRTGLPTPSTRDRNAGPARGGVTYIRAYDRRSGVKSRSDPARGARNGDGKFDARSSLTRGARAFSLGGAPRARHGHLALRPIGDAWCSARAGRDGSWIPCVQEQRHGPRSTSGRRANDQEPCRPARRDSPASLRPGNTSATRCRPADECGDSAGCSSCGLRPTRLDDVLLPVSATAGRGQRWPAPIARSDHDH